MRRGLALYLFGVFVGALDTSVIGPAFPLIAESFRVSLSWSAWTVTAYTVAYAAATVLAGALGDRHGRRALFLLGMGLFGVGSLVTATSGTLWAFLVGRAVQGAGAGAVFPNAQAEGVGYFPPERRGMALGIFGAVFGVAAVVGPNVGGALAQYFGWPSIFYLNLPLVALVLALAWSLPAARPGQAPLPDVIGGLGFAGGIAAALLALSPVGEARWPLLGAALVLIGIFAMRQRQLAGAGAPARPGSSDAGAGAGDGRGVTGPGGGEARQPFLDTRAVGGVAGLALISGAAVVGLDMSAAVFVPTVAQEALGMTVLGSGVAVMPAAVAGALLAGVGGVLTDRLGPKRVIAMGLGAAVLAGILMALPRLDLFRFIVAMAAFGVGTAFTIGAPLNRMALLLHAEERSGQALSLIAVFRTVGLAAGPVLLAAAHRAWGFPGLFGAVAVASALGIALFAASPDVRSGRREADAAVAR